MLPLPASGRNRRRHLAAALALAAALLPGAAGAATAAVPPSTRIEYEVDARTRGLGYGASAVLDWRLDGRRYEARMEFKAFLVGSRVQTSSGSVSGQGLKPERFTDRARQERVTRFDHEARQIHGNDGSSAPLPPGLQDKLSVFIQLGSRLAALASPPAPGASWTLPVATATESEPWTFRYAGAEPLALADGPLRAWHLVRRPRHDGDAEVEVWLAPELGWLPARIRIRENDGDSIDQRMVRR